MQHDGVWSLQNIYLKLGTKKILYLIAICDVSGDPQESKKLIVEKQDSRAAVPHVKS